MLKMYTITENVIPYTKLKIAEYMIDFGKLRIFDNSEENNLTRYFPFVCLQKVYAIQTSSLVNILEETIQA